ncbi:hypothetical protein BF242_004037 [Escherichia coli]|nr:hypothetical protein [Escherichia coli]
MRQETVGEQVHLAVIYQLPGVVVADSLLAGEVGVVQEEILIPQQVLVHLVLQFQISIL